MLELPFLNSGRIPYNSEVDSLVMNEILRKSDENDRYILGLLIAIMDRGNTWSNILTYIKYDTVKYEGAYYMSLIDDNINFVPTDASKWWKITDLQAQIAKPINKPYINVNADNIKVNDTVTFTVLTSDPRSSEFVWDIAGVEYEVIDGNLLGTLGKTIRIKFKEAGNTAVRVKAKTNAVGMIESDWSNTIYIRSAQSTTPGIIIRDTSLYGTQTYAGVKYTEGTFESYMSYDALEAAGDLIPLFLNIDGLPAEAQFPRNYLNKEFVITYNGRDYVGTFSADTSDGDRMKVTRRGVNIQPKQRPADRFKKPAKWTAKIEHTGYESGITYTEPVTQNTWFLFNKKSWDNSVPAEIMFFRADDIIGKLDFAGEYLGDKFRVETKDGERAWEGVFERAEEYNAPIVLNKVTE